MVRSFCPIVLQWAFIRGWYFAVKCLKRGCLLEHGHLLEILQNVRINNDFMDSVNHYYKINTFRGPHGRLVIAKCVTLLK